MANRVLQGAPSLSKRHLTVEIPDVSTADSVWITPGFQGKLVDIYTVIDGAIGTADVTIAAKHGTTTLGTVVVPTSGSGAGTVAFGTMTGPRHQIPEGDAIEVTTDGASSNTVKATVTLVVEAE